MIREVKFESQDRRIKQILAALNENGIKDIEEANAICDAAGIDPYKTCEETQPICFENAKWAYVVGCAIALKKGCKNAAEAAEAIGLGLQAFCIPGSVADDRKVGLGMATSLHVCSAKRLSASLSWLATSRLLLLKALSKSLPNRQSSQRAFARNPQRSWKRRRYDYLSYQRLYLCSD